MDNEGYLVKGHSISLFLTRTTQFLFASILLKQNHRDIFAIGRPEYKSTHSNRRIYVILMIPKFYKAGVRNLICSPKPNQNSF